MAGRKPNEDDAASQPKQQVQEDDARKTRATNFGNIEPDPEPGEIDPG